MGEILTGLARPRGIASPESILASDGDTAKGVAVMEKPTEAPIEAEIEVEADLREATAAAAKIAEAAKPKADATGFKPVRFVKNFNPHEKIRFKDGTTFVFPKSLFVCDDPILANKLFDVAEQYNIVLQ